MLPSRGVIRSAASAANGKSLTGQLISTRGYATSRLGRARHAQLTMASPLSRLRSGTIAGPIAISQVPSGSRALSLWGWGSDSKKPAEAPAEPVTEAAAPAPAPAPAPAAAEPAATAAAITDPAATSSVSPDVVGTDLSQIITSDLDKYGSISAIPEKIGYLHTLGIEFGWGTTSMLQWAFEHLHVYSGLPWWGTILAMSIGVRALLWKPIMLGQEHTTRLNILKQSEPGYQAAMDTLTSSRVKGDTVGRQAAVLAMKSYEEKYRVKKFMPLINMLQIPIGFGMFRILRAMSDLPVPSLETGGMLWFTDLTIPDPWFILPMVGPLAMLATMRITNRHGTEQQRRVMKMMTYVLGPLGFMVTSFMPAGLQWYFVTASTTGLVQTYLMFQPSCRRMLGLTALPDPAAVVETGPKRSFFEEIKKAMNDTQQLAGTKMETASKAKKETKKAGDEAKLQAQYYESQRERLAAQEKSPRMKRRP
ncbi:uncharacterized protein DNG_08773 [Cephalotrichum gorgonifer]|uniref:Membrane insertase YidC/Oxa/ALB C-terminal domain-containing protein n=1 Tax=Cephalotrichum gorgonifer TaxID=2041049 RepID=A0AAE8N5N2_9PEZI|nr:uncharacterized protein DNG_08773 [Cephalotrichum gorgonifer]